MSVENWRKLTSLEIIEEAISIKFADLNRKSSEDREVWLRGYLKNPENIERVKWLKRFLTEVGLGCRLFADYGEDKDES